MAFGPLVMFSAWLPLISPSSLTLTTATDSPPRSASSTPASSGCPIVGADCACATGPAPAVVALAAASWPAANAAPCGSSPTLATRRQQTAGITIGIRGHILDLLHARAAKKNQRAPTRGPGGPHGVLQRRAPRSEARRGGQQWGRRCEYKE